MVLSGIRPSFPSLSRSAGQITHVLLTRSPLEHPHQKGGGLSVRLACVKHAASVRPEPGSNSPKKQTKKSQAKNKETNKTKTNKHQQLSITIDIHIHVHVHVQTKFASSNDTLSSSQTTPPPTTPHHKKHRAANSDHTNIQTPPQNHKPPRHNNKNRDGYHAIPVTLLDLCPCEGFLASPQH